MSLDYVARGEGIKASTVNSLIDAVQGGGNMSPDLIVTGTRTGPQIVAPTAVGSTQLQTQCMFDVKNYILSGWPMAQFQLGFSLQDALNAVRVHDEDGVENAVSAILIYKNSSNCPFSGGTLSGRILREDDFQTNANVGKTGWIKTQMEGLHGSTYPNLQVWTTTSSVIEVITNAEDRETKQQLSSILSQNGMEEQQLSTLNLLDGCTLQKQVMGQGANAKPSSRTTFKNGVFDSYRVAAKKPWNAMLKAYLVCYSVEDGQEGAKDSHWTWLIPMGSGAAYNQTSEGVWTTQFTYGGDPIVLDVEEGALDNSFNGDPTWIEQSEFGNQVIAFGKFDSDGNSEIEPGQVWIDIEYDYQKFAVKGTINNGENDPPTTQSILGTAIKVAEAEPYKPKDDVVVGTEVHPSYIFNGTLGDLFKGEPKLDSYTPNDSQSKYSSLQWTERGKDGEQWQGGVTCRCLELYGFDDASSSDPTSADLYVARRFDAETSSATIVYIPLSSMGDVAPDSELSNAETSSLQWRTISADSGDVSSDLSADKKVIQLWNFDNVLCCYNEISTALSASQGESHLVLRNTSLSCVDYLQLSCLSTIVDTQGGTGQKSIDWLSGDYVAPFELQIYGFNEAEESQTTSSDLYLVRRAGENGPEVAYVKGISQEVVPDADLSSSQISSLQWRELRTGSGGEGEVSAKVMQMFNFDDMQNAYTDLSAAMSSEQHVVLRNAETSAVEYIQLSALSTQVSVDSQYAGEEPLMKSMQFTEIEAAGPQYLQLYDFSEDLGRDDYVSVQLSTDAKALLEEGYDFVVRKRNQNGDHTIEYKSLSVACLSGGTGGGNQLPGPFEMQLSSGTASFTNCCLRIARAYFFFQDQTLQIPQTDSIVYVKAEHTDPPTIQMGAGDYATVTYNLGNSWSNCLSTTVTPLYRTLSGEVKCDYRYMMNIQAYDSRNYSESI